MITIQLILRSIYNLRSGSWLAWANDTMMHYAAIHSLPQQTAGSKVQPADMPLPQSDTLGFHFIAHKLLLNSPEGRRLSWPDLQTIYTEVWYCRLNTCT